MCIVRLCAVDTVCNMPCYRPVTCWKDPDGGPISFHERKDFREIKIPCSRCIGCRIMIRDGWAFRCYAESQLHKDNCFLTLTYNEDNLPVDNSLNHRHWQLFMKSLRQKFGPMRFFMCGEYGEQFSRPHYHALVFGFRPNDMRQSNSMYSKHALFESDEVQKVWGHGYVSVGEVSLQSARYCAAYAVKKMSDKDWQDNPASVHVDKFGEIHTRIQPYAKMSLKPGIGAAWLERYRRDVLTHDGIVTHGGMKMRIPRYFDDLMELCCPDDLMDSKMRRLKKVEKLIDDNTRERLEVREQIAHAKVKFNRERKGYAL